MNVTDWSKFVDKSGKFERPQTTFHEWISSKPGSRFSPEKGRYHLYVSYACPWAHRVLIARKLKGLEDAISCTVVHWHIQDGGWRFANLDDEGVDEEHRLPHPDHQGFTHLRQVYYESDPSYQARFSVPALYDSVNKVIVNNESSEILRMFGTEFDNIIDTTHREISLYSEVLQGKIDEANDWQYTDINNGVYKCGIAGTQKMYDLAVTELFQALDRVEAHFKTADGPFWFGRNMSEVDIRLFVTIIRFDPVYVQHFKCNIRDIRSGYPCTHKWLRNLYWNVPAFRETTDFLHIKYHYTKSHVPLNPSGITAMGPLPHILPLDEEVSV